jgi:Glycosyl hydrolase family 26
MSALARYKTLAASVAITLIATAAVLAGAHVLAGSHPAAARPRAQACARARQGMPYIGVAAVSLKGLHQFGAATGTRPGLLVIYRSFGTPLSAADVAPDLACGILPLLQLNPYGVSLTAIAAGRYDAYLRRYGAALRHLGARVALSFAPEANGRWYSWGCGHTPAAVYVAAWRHIHDVITRAAGRRIIWVWDVNSPFPGSCPVGDRWPGASYVDWVGLDGYPQPGEDTFATVLAPAIVAVRTVTNKPVLIAETGVSRVPGAAAFVRSLFAGAEDTPGVIGVTWFEYTSPHGDYRLENDPPALAEFRREARNYH